MIDSKYRFSSKPMILKYVVLIRDFLDVSIQPWLDALDDNCFEIVADGKLCTLDNCVYLCWFW